MVRGGGSIGGHGDSPRSKDLRLLLTTVSRLDLERLASEWDLGTRSRSSAVGRLAGKPNNPRRGSSACDTRARYLVLATWIWPSRASVVRCAPPTIPVDVTQRRPPSTMHWRAQERQTSLCSFSADLGDLKTEPEIARLIHVVTSGS
jgi:hypothetical protein